MKEDLEVKHQLWQQVAQTAKPEALFATNTSGIPIEAIAKAFGPEDKKRFSVYISSIPTHYEISRAHSKR